ncbi:CPK16, partial [Symbiodinium pilosum]
AYNLCGWLDKSPDQQRWKGDEIVATNYVEVGIKLPKVPGLTNIMEFFVKSYGTQHDPKHNAFKNSYRGSILERFSVGLLHTL